MSTHTKCPTCKSEAISEVSHTGKFWYMCKSCGTVFEEKK